jgi:putative DNA primase/helicase
MLTLAGQDHPITTAPTRLDADAHLFNTPAGTLDLNSGKLKEHDRADLITKVTTAGFADRPAPIWTAFLERILPDPDVRAFIQRLMGVAMFGAVREQYLPIFTGTGANGKGVFRDALMHAFGDYGFEVDPAMLMQQHNARHGTFLMDLRGRRLVFCSETERGSRFAEAQMKRLTGGDPITANRMHKDPVKFDPSHTLVMITNQLPVVSGDDPAVWRRILVVPFDVTIPVEDRDPGLPEKLKAEADSVLSWAFQGWVEYQRIGLAPPAAVRARTDAYRTDSDVLARFIDERCMLMGQIKARDLFTEFSRWTRAAGEEPGTETSFGKQMAARSMPKQRTTSGFVYKGLMLAAGEEDE